MRKQTKQSIDYEKIGEEVTRLWQRAVALHHTMGQLGVDVDKLMCWGPEAHRAENQALSKEKRAELRVLAGWKVSS